MVEPHPVKKESLFAHLPPEWPEATLREQISRSIAETNRCIIALDDDPTGTQTVHNITVVTKWEVDDLTSALAQNEPALYILTNSRSVPLAQAQALNREIATNMSIAAEVSRRPITFVSRSDSTLRGHYPGEIKTLQETLIRTLGVDFDGLCLIPFFPEGGRFTIGDVHWVQEGDTLIPAAQTPYAQDPVFGYAHSHLPKWIEEKTEGEISSSDVFSISIDQIRSGGPALVANRLFNFPKRSTIVINAASYRDLDVFVTALRQVEASGKQFLFRTAASFVKVAAGLSDIPLLTRHELIDDRVDRGGLIVVGSFVPKSTAQLEALMNLEGVDPTELSVRNVLENSTRPETIAAVADAINDSLSSSRNALVYTSREIITGRNETENLSISKSISQALVDVVSRIKQEPRFVIGKGGITSSDLATEGMQIRAARVLGQIYPGVPVWRLEYGSRWPGIPFIVFPGNVGEPGTIANIVRMLEGNSTD